jgi:hypothetical protein
MIDEETTGIVSVSQGVDEAPLPPAGPVTAGPEGIVTEIEPAGPVGTPPAGTLTEGIEPVGTEPEGIRGVLETPMGVAEGRLGMETEAEGAGAPGMLQPVNHSMMMSWMLTLMSMPVQPPRKAASSARASQDRTARLSPPARRPRALRRLMLREAMMVSVRKAEISTKRPLTRSRDVSTEAETDSQSKTTAFSSTPREQLEPDSQTARAVRTSTSREAASLPAAQAWRATRISASMSTASWVFRKAARVAWAWTERAPASST